MLDSTEDPARALRDAFGCFATGVTVVTLRDPEGRPAGLTVNSFSSLSLTPPLCLFSVGRSQVSAPWFKKASAFAVNVLALEQEALAWQFARPAEDKFSGVEWTHGNDGVPLLDGALATFECRTWDIHDGGDHHLVIGEIVRHDRTGAAPLLFHRGKMVTLAPEAEAV